MPPASQQRETELVVAVSVVLSRIVLKFAVAKVALVSVVDVHVDDFHLLLTVLLFAAAKVAVDVVQIPQCFFFVSSPPVFFCALPLVFA